MAYFEQALPFVLKHEGGWSDDPDDPGGATNHGITLETARRYGIQTKEELKAITPEDVASIYRSGYWRFNGLTSQDVATKLFDMAVNMGLRTAIRIAQDCLNTLGASLVSDGSFGPITEATINAVAPKRMLDLLCQASAEHYRHIVLVRSSSDKFLKGWLARADEVPS
jgi:lysozyme family protein